MYIGKKPVGTQISLVPTPEAVLDSVVPNYIHGVIYGALVESFCSEQNSRMMAMQSATDNAKDMLHELEYRVITVFVRQPSRRRSRKLLPVPRHRKRNRSKQAMNKGKIVQVMGPVVDVEFERRTTCHISKMLWKLMNGRKTMRHGSCTAYR